MTVRELIELNQMITDVEITVRDNGFLTDQLNIGCARGEKPRYPQRVPRDSKYARGMNVRDEKMYKDAAYIPKSINSWDDGKDYWQVKANRIPKDWLELEVTSWEVHPASVVTYHSPRRQSGVGRNVNFHGQCIWIDTLPSGKTLSVPKEKPEKQEDHIEGQMSIEDWDYEVIEI